jgi:hypothetical protein
MKYILICIFLGLTQLITGQIEPVKIHFPLNTSIISMNTVDHSQINDSIPLIEYRRSIKTEKEPAYFINGDFINQFTLKTIDPLTIDSIYVDRKEIKINNTIYYGQIYVKLKDEYNPRFISLTDLKKKYVKSSTRNFIFIIDNEIIRGDYEKLIVDEKYILKIVVDTMRSEKSDLDIIRLITRTKENIEKSKQIILRGLD